MIEIKIAPDVLACGHATEVVISVANRSQSQTAYGLAIEFEPDGLIRLDHGAGLIEIDELRPGTVDDRSRVTLTGRSTGVGKIGFPYVTYWTDAGSVRPTIPPLSVQIDRRSEPDRTDRRPPPPVAPEPHAPFVFISHRHADSGWLGQFLRARLASHLTGSRVFLDHDDLAPGDLWPKMLDQQLDRATALLALIGPNWETLANETGIRRIHLPDDVVRCEIITALRRRILIIPVLHDRSTPPRAEELPQDLRPLLERQCVRVDHRTQSHTIRDIAIRLRGVGLI